MSWRDKIDPLIKEHLELQIIESFRHKKIYSEAKDKKNAQLWVAVANLSKQVFELNLKVKFLERVLRETNKGNKKSESDVKKVIKAMKKF